MTSVEHIARLHASLVFTALGVTIAAACLLTYQAWRHNEHALIPKHYVDGTLWIVQLLVVAECALGAWLWWNGLRPARGEIHIVYAAVAVVTLPAATWYAQTAPNPRSIQALASVFLCAILLRALVTARPPG